MKKRKNDKLIYYKSLFKQIPHLENEIAVLDKKIKEAKDNVGTIKSPSDWESIRLENATFNPHDDKSADMVWELTQERHKLLNQREDIELVIKTLPEEIREVIIKVYVNKSHSYTGLALRRGQHTTELQREVDKVLEEI